FRPVNLNNGPDGCLYIVDLYHGILQHHLYITSYLRQQILDRGLEKHTDFGRIYRVVNESKPAGSRPQLSKASPEELVKSLSHPKVRAAAMRISEPLLKNQPELVNELLKHTSDTAPDAQLQLAFTLGEVKEPRAEEAMAKIARQNARDLYIRDAVITGLDGHELEFLERLLADKDWNEEKPGSDKFLAALAQCVFREAKPERINRLLELA